MGNTHPGVVVVTRFCMPRSRVFSKYVDYIDREDAQRQEALSSYNLYNDYMDNPEKTSGLFTDGKTELGTKDKEHIKDIFKTAQENGSIMWQTVISFDNQWLERYGLYDTQTNSADELKIKELATGAVNRMLKNEGLENALWSGAIHYNTDNLHIHIATVEPYPTRSKKEYTVYDADGNPTRQEEYIGKFKGKSIELCKKYIVDNIIQQQDQNIIINNLIRNVIVQGKRQTPIAEDPELKDAFLKLYAAMPKNGNKGLWNYNNNIMRPLHPMIDDVSNAYLHKYHEEDLNAFKRLLILQSNTYKAAYGGDRDFSLNKIQDLYTRLGNAILAEIRDYDKELEKIQSENPINKAENAADNNEKLFSDRESDLYDINKAISYLEKSEKKENPYADYYLGKIYTDPQNNNYDPEKGIKYLTKSAESGNQYAQLSLGCKLLKGEITARNISSAKNYITMAAEQGNEAAKNILNNWNRSVQMSAAAPGRTPFSARHTFSRSLTHLKKSMNNEYQSWINMQKFRELEKEISKGQSTSE